MTDAPPTGGLALSLRRVAIVAAGLLVVGMLRVLVLAITARTETVQTLRPPAAFADKATGACNVFVVKTFHNYGFFVHDVRYEAVIGVDASYGVGLPIKQYWLPSYENVTAEFSDAGVRIVLPPLPAELKSKGSISYDVPAAWCTDGR